MVSCVILPPPLVFWTWKFSAKSQCQVPAVCLITCPFNVLCEYCLCWWYALKLLDLCMNSHFLASLTFIKSLVLSYNSTTNCSNSDTNDELMSSFIKRRSSNALLALENTFHVFQAAFFPLSSNAETVSHPVNAWKTCKVLIIIGSILLATLWIGM